MKRNYTTACDFMNERHILYNKSLILHKLEH